MTTLRNALNIKNISSVMLINCVGLSVHTFLPDPYVVPWIHKRKRSFDKVNCLK